MAKEFTAQLSLRDGQWHLYVVLLNSTERWPDHSFSHAVPTFTERTDALSVLGFEQVPGAPSVAGAVGSTALGSQFGASLEDHGPRSGTNGQAHKPARSAG
ncbi:DUF6303 family protein [Streptomyces scabiei]|uniref:DUF6303 family protein n=1 Tax=Streptomyces scabiei TaxID=1930 RepID=UPI00298FF9BB|nr:DUF6303 family protein [Streptomyces scabiei]MDW8808395.1 DUF6303 family protein [Streptomyces scabiei]